MKITKVHDITFNIEEDIMTASLSAHNELVMSMSSGKVIRYNIDEQKEQDLFPVKGSLQYSDGGFDINAPSTIYTLDSIVAIVNDYKRHGFVHYPNNYHALHFSREDYHANISCYPLALFKNENGVPHMIYGKAWNHIQIMNLDTRQILTASKSLIIEGAEEWHIKSVEKHGEGNKLAWPSPYDYFFGKLEMSPDKKNFISAGWGWGSVDEYNIYEVKNFINNNRILDKNIGYWEHSVRAVCWIDNETVAIAYNPYEEGDESATKDSPDEIHFYKVNGKEPEIERKVEIIGLDIVSSKMYFNQDFNSIVLFSDKTGVVLLSLNGEILFHDAKMNQDAYYPDLNLFLKTDSKSVMVHQIKK